MNVNGVMRRFLEFRFRGEIPDDWRPVLAEVNFVRTLEDSEVRRLVQLARMFESVVTFDGRDGMDVDQRMIRLRRCRRVVSFSVSATSAIAFSVE